MQTISFDITNKKITLSKENNQWKLGTKLLDPATAQSLIGMAAFATKQRCQTQQVMALGLLPAVILLGAKLLEEVHADLLVAGKPQPVEHLAALRATLATSSGCGQRSIHS